ncbi:MAG: alpha/beta hydrolase [Myxococcales bacterium]|nr:alpha/beta hydrolase [Myxococcales bacterium]
MSEQPIRISVAGGALELEAALASGDDSRGAVIAPPHPEYGGRFDNPVVLALAAGLGQAGLSTLRFNFRGTGASGGQMSGDQEPADEDYGGALDARAQRATGPYLAAGYSFGAATATRVASKRSDVQALLLVAPPLPLMDLDALAGLGRPVTVVIGDDDNFSPIEALRAVLEGMGHVTLDVIAGADHFFFSGGLDRIAELSARAVR